ncbi:MAG: HEAT repeat domain-containing protein [Pyrinomonadaceae bacterium]|nr:HEAT repeat domain-containing protein [Phycisphaerales bacterium]
MDRNIALQVRAQPWGAMALELATDQDAATRISIASLAAATAEPALVRELGRLITDEHEEVSEAAERALADLAHRVSASGQEEVSGVLAEVLMNAAAAYDSHRQRSVLGVIIRRWGTPAGLAELTRLAHVSGNTTWLDDAAHPVQMGLRSILRREADPAVAAAAMVWLKLESLAPACRDRLLQPGTSNEHLGILQAIHLLENPRRAAALAGMAQASGKRNQQRDLIWAARHEVVSGLPEAVRVFVPGWLGRLPLPGELRNSAIADYISDPSPLVRHAAVRMLARGRTTTDAPGSPAHQDAAAATLTDFCFDTDERVSLAAARTKLRLDPPICFPGGVLHTSQDSTSVAGSDQTIVSDEAMERSAIWKHLARSEHAGVRGLAHAVVDRFDTSDPATTGGMLATWRMLRREPDRVIAHIKHQLADATPEERIIGIRRAIRFGVVEHVEVELVRLVWSGSSSEGGNADTGASRVAATAVSALGELDTQASRGALRTSLAHDDPRIRSNSIEALSKQARRLGDAAVAPAWLEGTIIDFKDDAQHRVRATAAWLLVLRRSLGVKSTRRDAWRVGVATAGAMIRDERPGHALAGLWLTERIAAHGLMTGIGDLNAPLGHLLLHDDLDVRARAIRCWQRVTGETDESWLLQQAGTLGNGEFTRGIGAHAREEAAA